MGVLFDDGGPDMWESNNTSIFNVAGGENKFWYSALMWMDQTPVDAGDEYGIYTNMDRTFILNWVQMRIDDGGGVSRLNCSVRSNPADTLGACHSPLDMKAKRWYHLCFVNRTSSFRECRVDAGQIGTNTTDVSVPADLDYQYVGRDRSGASLFDPMSGIICEVAAWIGHNPSEEQVRFLAGSEGDGFGSPLDIGVKPTMYLSMGSSSHTTSRFANHTFTKTGTTSAMHAPMRSISPIFVKAAAAAAGAFQPYHVLAPYRHNLTR